MEAKEFLQAEEISFMADELTMIDITPTFSLSKMELMKDTYGPFRAGRRTKVPLWLAVFLHGRSACTLIPPDWLSPRRLSALVNQERSDENQLQPVPPFYYEISRTYFKHARDNLQRFDELLSLVEHLHRLRLVKLQKLVSAEFAIGNDGYHSFPNATRMEINICRQMVHGFSSYVK